MNDLIPLTPACIENGAGDCIHPLHDHSHDKEAIMRRRSTSTDPPAPIMAKIDPNTDPLFVTLRNIRKAQDALKLLCKARDLLKEADHQQTLRRVRLAISSAKGAVRIAEGRHTRAQMNYERNIRETLTSLEIGR